MIRNSRKLIGIQFLSLALLIVMAVSSFAYQMDTTNNNTANNDSIVIAASDGLSYGITKKEAYDKKGVPDKINRMSGEEGREMWVYKCQNDDGWNEDCLYLYFDGDKLVKIERL